MVIPSTDATYLTYQYDDSEKLRIRIETHQRYTAGDDDYPGTLVRHIRPAAGLRLLDVGCGPGELHQVLSPLGVNITGIDRSFGMLREATVGPGPAGNRFAQADAVALPFRDAQFERVVAIGVLYHVRDWPTALLEMRRVTRSGGRVVVSTNGPDAMQRIVDVHREAAVELGYTPLESKGATFNLDDLAQVRDVFPSVVRHVTANALVFRDPEPALRFYATNRIDLLVDPPPDGSHRDRLLPHVRTKISAIIAREGEFRVPKTYGYFVADI